MEVNGIVQALCKVLLNFQRKKSYVKLPQGQEKTQRMSSLACNISRKLNYHHLQKTIAVLQKQLPENTLERKSRTYQKLKYSTEFKN